MSAWLVRSESATSRATTRTGAGSRPSAAPDAPLPDTPATQRTSTRQPSAICLKRDSSASGIASRSSSRSSGRAPRIDWVRIMRASAPSGSPTLSRVIARIRAAMPCAPMSRQGTGIGAKPFGGRTQIDSSNARRSRSLELVSSSESPELRSALSSCGRPTTSESVASWDIAPIRRKNGARRALVGALLALAAASACADLEAKLESRKARHEAQRLSAPAYHTVRPGETLGEIAKRYRVGAHELASANDLRDSDHLFVGERLEIPIRRIVHQVGPGETLQSIAARYRVRVSTIAYLNRMGISRRVKVGQRLVIPRRATSESVATSRSRPEVSAAPPPSAVAAAPKRAEPPAPRVDADQERLARARRLVDHAVADYRAARFDAGIEQAWAAEDVLRPIGDRPDARKLSARAAFVAGSAQAARGEEDRATESFARVHELDPEFEPPSGWLSPRLETLYTEAQPD